MIKILVINTVKFHTNGISNVIMSLYQNMDRKNMLFDFVVNEEIEDKYKEIILDNQDKYYILKKRNKNPILYINHLSDLIRKNKYDIIHIHGNSALMSIELIAIRKSESKAKIVVHAHNTGCTHQILNKLLYSYFIKHYDYAIACSQAAGKWLYKDNDYFVLNNGIDEQRFSYRPDIRDKYRKEKNLENKFVITHIGRFNEQKNHMFLIDVFEAVHNKNPNAILRLVGTGELLDQVRKKVNERNLSDFIEFVGVIDRVEVEYQIADVFVLPSLYESFGLVNVEAQCAGLPCVVSDTVPHEIKITENMRFLSLQSSAEIWADAILSFENYVRKSYHEQVVESNYSISKIALELSEFYRSIML